MPDPSSESGSKNSYSKRWYAAKEIVDSEKVYVNNLKIVKDLYNKLLGNSSLDANMLNSVFSNIGDLHTISENIYDELVSEVKKHNGDYNESNLGKVIGRLAGFLKMYTQYVNGYNKSLEIIAESTKKKDTFYNECEKATKNELRGMDLSSYLIMPVQRIPRYRLLLQTLLKYTPESNIDYLDIVKALEIIKQIATLCDAAMLPDLNKVINQIHLSLGKNINLINPRRKIEEHKEATLLEFQSKLHIFLCYFNDILLIYSKKADTLQVLYIFEYIYTNYILVLPEESHVICFYDNEKACNIQFDDLESMNENIQIFMNLNKRIKKRNSKCSYCGYTDNEDMDDLNHKYIDLCLQCHNPVCKNCSIPYSYFDLEQLTNIEGVLCKYCAVSTTSESIDNHIDPNDIRLPKYWHIYKEDSKEPYYYNQILWKSTYRNPKFNISNESDIETSNIPIYWKIDYLNDLNCTSFYYNIYTEQTQWEKPQIKSKSVSVVSTDLIRICLKCHTLYPDTECWEPTCINCQNRLSFPYHFSPKDL